MAALKGAGFHKRRTSGRERKGATLLPSNGIGWEPPRDVSVRGMKRGNGGLGRAARRGAAARVNSRGSADEAQHNTSQSEDKRRARHFPAAVAIAAVVAAAAAVAAIVAVAAVGHGDEQFRRLLHRARGLPALVRAGGRVESPEHESAQVSAVPQ